MIDSLPAQRLARCALSLFHVVVPAVLMWMLHELGYDWRALVDDAG